MKPYEQAGKHLVDSRVTRLDLRLLTQTKKKRNVFRICIIRVNKTEANLDTDVSSHERCKIALFSCSIHRVSHASRLLDKPDRSTNGSITAGNSVLKQRIPSFLRVYSQAPTSNDSLLQWNLFNLSELEKLNTMMARLYKNENLARVQRHETYRTALLSSLASKTSSVGAQA